MFKIVTDPTQYPVREVDLTASAGALCLTPTASGRSRDLTWERADGGLNVARRKRRVDATLTVGALEGSQARALQEVLGLSAYNAPRVSAYLFPPFDASTSVAVPFQGSGAAWIRNASDLLDLSAVTFGGGGSRYEPDEWGRWSASTPGSPRFQPGVLGRSILIDRARTNLAATPHPSSGAVGWAPGSGGPSVAFTSSVRSPYVDAAGVAVVTRNTGGTCQVFASPTATVSGSISTRLRVSVWVRGNVAGRMLLTNGAQSEWSPVQSATADGWTRWTFELDRTATDTSLSTLLDFDDDGNDRTVYLGPMLVEEYTDDGAPWVPGFWTPSTTTHDNVGVTVRNRPGAMSKSVATRVPVAGRRCRLWWLGGGGGDHLNLEWDATGLRFNTGQGALVRVDPPTLEWIAAEGRPCVITARLWWDPAAQFARASLRIAYTLQDGGPVRVWSTDAGPGFMGQYAFSTSLTLGSFSDWEPVELGLSWVRYDLRAWSDIQTSVWERCLLESGFRDVFALTQGRRFLLGDLELEPIPGTTMQRATLTAQEQSVDTDLAVYV